MEESKLGALLAANNISQRHAQQLLYQAVLQAMFPEICDQLKTSGRYTEVLSQFRKTRSGRCGR